MNDQARFEFVSDVIRSFQDAGMTHREIKTAVAMAADAAEKAADAGYDLDRLGKAAMEKDANLLSAIGATVPVTYIADTAKDLFNRGVGLGAATVTDIGKSIVSATPAAAALGLAGTAAAGYGAGHLAGIISDDPSDAVKEIRHQEYLKTLRENADMLRRHRQLQSGEYDDDTDEQPY